MTAKDHAPEITAAVALRILDALGLSEIERAKLRFIDRNLPTKAINRLVESGVRFPEELLATSYHENRRVPGIGELFAYEIHTYRCRWLPNFEETAQPAIPVEDLNASNDE